MKKTRFFSDKVRINTIMILFFSFLTIMYGRHITYTEEINGVLAEILYAIKYVPIILVTALGGAVPGMISVIIVFMYRSIIHVSFSYLVYIYLVVACITDFFSKKKVFNSLIKTLLASFFLQFVTGDLWGILLVLLSGADVSLLTAKHYFAYFLYEAPGCIFGYVVVYLIFKYLPDKKKVLLGNGIFYVNKDSLSEDERYEAEGHSKIGRVVMQIIVFEAILLGVSAEIASNTLIPTIKNEITAIETENGQGFEIAHNVESLENMVSILILENTTVESSALYDTLSENGYRVMVSVFAVKLAMLISIVVIPLAIFVNRYAQWRIAKPIRSLSKAVSRIYNSNEDDLDKAIESVHSLGISTKDEIEDLYHVVDLTIYRLMEYIELVKSRQNVEDQLRIEKSANEAKSRFLSNISHEIRTPINAVLGFDEMILRETRDKKVIEYAKDIQSSGRTLLALINDVLDFSKIEAGKMEINPVEYELGSIINDIVNMASVRALEKNLELKVNVNEDIPHVLFGDEVRIKQCIINIITNAVKYTEKGSVTLDIDYEKIFTEENDESAYDERIKLFVKVTDTGIGIKEEDMAKLSTAFERIDEKRNRTIEGTGLGINIVSSLLGMMNSKLEVKSEYGKGSEFSFNIVQTVVNAEPIGNYSNAYDESIQDAHEYHESFHAPDARILVVDDTRTNLTVVEGLLKQTQITVDTCTSGMDALELVAKNRYDIIFLDHRMPEMDGIQTFHAMQESTKNLNKNVPVIALTANAVSGSREMYFKEGFTNYMAKPVDPLKLEDMIMSYLPSFKVSRPGDKDFVSTMKEDDQNNNGAMEELLKLGGVDLEAAISRCGSPEVAKDVMKDFKLAIDERSGLIERYFNEGNIKNYTIYVHGLKSSARAIGALDLADKAEYLEECGNKERLDEIKELTPKLLELYRSYNQKLALLFDDNDQEKPEISEEELEGAFSSIKEFVSASYFDSADDIMKMLEDYRIPMGCQDKYNEVKRLLSTVDRDGLLNIL